MGRGGPALAALLLASCAPEPARSATYDAGAGQESARLFGGIHGFAYYFIDLLVGLPTPQRASAILDTGSSLVGFPCSGCKHCGRRHLDPAFNFSRSGSSRWMSCGSSQCRGSCVEGRCAYRQEYSEGSAISGAWFSDFVELGDDFQRRLPVRTQLGCHSFEDKLFFTQRANGIMGLAPWDYGAESTILEDLFADRAHVDAHVFSICLAMWGGMLTVGGYNSSYHVRRGEDAIQWVDMVIAEAYWISPEALWLGDMPVAAAPSELGPAIVDSGTTYTYFPPVVYSTLRTDIDTYCNTHGFCGAAPHGDDCWLLDNKTQGPTLFPNISLQFAGGVQVEWPANGYLQPKNEVLLPGVWCLAFDQGSADDEIQTVLGMTWMMHHEIIFDLRFNRLGIAKARCPSHYEQPGINETGASRRPRRGRLGNHTKRGRSIRNGNASEDGLGQNRSAGNRSAGAESGHARAGVGNHSCSNASCATAREGVDRSLGSTSSNPGRSTGGADSRAVGRNASREALTVLVDARAEAGPAGLASASPLRGSRVGGAGAACLGVAASGLAVALLSYRLSRGVLVRQRPGPEVTCEGPDVWLRCERPADSCDEERADGGRFSDSGPRFFLE